MRIVRKPSELVNARTLSLSGHLAILLRHISTKRYPLSCVLNVDKVRDRGSPNRESQHTSQDLLVTYQLTKQ